MRGVPVLCVLAACHVTTRNEISRPAVTQRTQQPSRAIAGAPQLVLTDTAELRFVEPLSCPTEEVVTTERATEVTTRPNLATFIVGVIATGVGGVIAVTGATGDEPGSSPLTYVGLGGAIAGLPLAIGPWVGNRTLLEAQPSPAPITRPGPVEPCGARALRARSAVLAVRGIEVHGAIAEDGTFAVSPFQFIDAYDVKRVTTWSITATVDGTQRITADLEAGALAGKATAFLAHAEFDAKVEPLRLVPGIVAGRLRASLTSTAAGAALRIVLPLENQGPGDAYGLRGHVSSSTKAIDGRVLYIGRLAKGAASTRELLVPLAPEAAMTLRGASLELSVELVDAHGTAPVTPIRFQGIVLGDAPR